MARVDECEQKVIQAKVKKLIWKSLDQKGASTLDLVALCRGEIKELKAKHSYRVLNWIGRAITMLIKEDRARISYDSIGVLKFFTTK